MNIIIKGSHIDITDSLKDYLEKKVMMLQKFLGPNARVEADLGKTSNHHKTGDIFRAELNITNEGVFTRTVAEQGDLYSAIDRVKDEMADILASKKDKKRSLFKSGASKIKNIFKFGREAEDVSKES